ncbi:recombinase family protein [Caproiciproducens sp.]|uniref:recombinase family protein n=1 Tax=Caproiciproducens sp. TaxID=1954376 RepID=UPI0028A281A5|nr:recombinase family protein [Caproiciproducens sp.]
MDSKHRAWLYCRVDAPEDRNGVLKKQEKQLFEFSEQLGYQPVGTSSDLGGNSNLEKLIQTAVKHFDVLLVGSLFHIHYDRNKAIQYVRQLQSLGVEVLSPLEGHIFTEEVPL